MSEEENPHSDWFSSVASFKTFAAESMRGWLSEHLLTVCALAAGIGVVATLLVGTFKGDSKPTTSSFPSQSVTSMASVVYVDVDGAVARPGIYRLSNGSRVSDALKAAGDSTQNADLSRINRAAVVRDGQKLFVPEVGQSGLPVGDSSASADANGPVNINDASSEQLQTLPGVGPATAQAIVTYRDKQGSFKSVEDLNNVPGIGPAKLARLKPLITV